MKENQHIFKLGDEKIFLKITEWSSSGVVYINLHENEQTSVLAAKEVLSKDKGVLIELQSKGERLITFNHKDNKHSFDPNRIFTSNGIRNTLNENGTYNLAIEFFLATFADSILEKIFSYNPALIVALHNTTGEYSIESYLSGGQFENDKADIFINPLKKNTDLFFTINRELFNKIKDGQYNVVLQDNDAVSDDGSLSVYCALNKINYVNVEAGHGNLKEQKEMIDFIAGVQKI